MELTILLSIHALQDAARVRRWNRSSVRESLDGHVAARHKISGANGYDCEINKHVAKKFTILTMAFSRCSGHPPEMSSALGALRIAWAIANAGMRSEITRALTRINKTEYYEPAAYITFINKKKKYGLRNVKTPSSAGADVALYSGCLTLL